MENLNYSNHNKCSDFCCTKVENLSVTIGTNKILKAVATKTLNIPASIEIIDNSAFEGGSIIEEVIFEEGSKLKEIKTSVFETTTNLKSINLEVCKELTYIGYYAFLKSGITEITIPASVTTIEYSAFGDCSQLASVTFEEGSLLETISGYAFNEALLNEKFNLEACTKLTSMGENVFMESGLVSITIPDSLTSIPYGCFYGCSQLEEVIFGENTQVAKFERSAFNQCGKIKTFVIPNTVTELDEYVICGCPLLESIIFEEGSTITELKDGAFVENPMLKTIVLPATIKTIHQTTFSSYMSEGEMTVYCEVSLSELAEAFTCKYNYAQFIYYSETEPTDTTYRYWRLVDGIPTIWE